MRTKNWLSIAIIALLFLGISTHWDAIPTDAKVYSNTSFKTMPKTNGASQTLIDKFSQKFASKFDENAAFPQKMLEAQKRANTSTSVRDYLTVASALKRPESPVWKKISASLLESVHRSPMHRETSHGDDDSEILDTVFTSDVRVNNPYSLAQIQPDFAIGSDGIVYATWIDQSGTSEYAVFFAKSTDGGITWSSRLEVDNVGPNYRPSIAASGSGSTAKIYIAYVYPYDTENYDYDVYCAISQTGGDSWLYATLGGSSYYEDVPAVAVDSAGYAYVAYTYATWSSGSCDDGDVSTYLVYRYSANNGSTWSSQITLVSSGSISVGLPALALQGGGTSAILHLGYCYDYGGSSSDDYDVHYRKYSNVGTTSPTTVYSDRYLAQSTSNEYVIYGGLQVGTDGNPQIVYQVGDPADVYYRKSSDGGNSFGSAVIVSNGSWEESDPTMALDPDNNPLIVWRDARHGDYDIYFTWSPNGGTSFVPAREVDMELTGANQYWPSILSYNTGCERHIHFGWWDARYDEGDIYYNGNVQKKVQLNVTFPTGTPTNLPHFVYHEFDEAHDTILSAAGTYRFWYDPEYTSLYEPLLDYLLPGYTGSERWACDNPGGWTYLATNDWWGNGVCGTYNAAFYRQVRITFEPHKGNPAACVHTIPSLSLRYNRFARIVDTFVTVSMPVTDWVNYGSSYFFRGWTSISPHERWAITSAETTGTANFAGTISPTYYHQWYHLIQFAGTGTGNTTWTTQRWNMGASGVTTGLIDRWQDWADCGSMLAFSETTSFGLHAINDYDTLAIEWIPSYTIIYTTDNFLTVQNDFGFGNVVVDGTLYDSPHRALYGPGTVHTIEAPTPQTFGDTLQYRFTQWSDGVTTAVRNITIPDRDISYTAEYDRYHKLVMGYTGPTGGHIPVVTGGGWYREGSMATITATAGFDSTSGVRYGFSHWESIPAGATFTDATSPTTQVLVNRYYTIRAVYAVQYAVEIFSDYGTPVPSVGVNWFDAGASVTVRAGTPDTIAHKYCNGFLASGSGLPASGTANTLTFTLTSACWIRWQWADQLRLLVRCDYGLPVPRAGLNYYDPGTSVTARCDSIVLFGADIRQLCTGYVGTDGIGSGADNNVTFTITTNCTLDWNYQTQYVFEVRNPGSHDSPSPAVGRHWRNAGTSVTAFVTSPSAGFVCIGYSGTGSLPFFSPYDSVTFTLSSPSVIEWRWASESDVVSLTVNSYGGAGDPEPSGTTWWLRGSSVTAYVISPYYDSYPDGVRDVCTGWAGSGSTPASGSNDTVSFVINVNSAIFWNWGREYRFTVASPLGFGAPTPTVGEHWYADGTTITGSATSPWLDTLVCIGYDGTGSLSDGTASTFSFAIHAPSSITWLWDANTIQLTVNSPYGTPTPSTGTHSYALGTIVTCSVDSLVYGADGIRYRCIGWTGTGNIPATGTGRSVTATLTVHSTITWRWQREYRLLVNNGGHGNPTPPSGANWYPEGTVIDCSIAPNPSDTFYCVGYTGTGSVGTLSGYDHTRVTLMEPSSITWVWLGASSVAALLVSSDYGSPFPDAGAHYYPRGTTINAYMPSATDSLGVGHRRHCTGYAGTGSVGSAADTSVSFTINLNSTLEWNWEDQYRLSIYNPGGYDSPNPPAGDHWYASGTEITASITPVVDTMRCVGYFGTGSVPSSGWGASVRFTLLMPSSLTWRWFGPSGLCQLTVNSDHGFPTPPIGTSYIPCGEFILASVALVDSTSPGTGWYCDGWTGTNSVPPVGDTNFVAFTLSATSSITWNWTRRNLLVLTYTGETGGEIPTQTGAGWHAAIETVSVSSQPVLFDGSTHYGFAGWSCRGGSIWIENPDFAATRVIVSVPCTLVANYSVAVACTLVKNPAQDFGGFVIDGITYPHTDTLAFWWGRSSHHLIAATSPDMATDSSISYVFNNWSDGGAREHTIEASASFRLVANYLRSYRAIITKNPAQTLGSITVDGVLYPTSSSWRGYFAEGSVHTISVTSPDTGSGNRYSFTSWSDGITSLTHDLGPISSAVNLNANYNREVRVAVTKNPTQSFGDIKIGGSTFARVSAANKYVTAGTNVTVEVTAIDVDTVRDSAYVFLHWNASLLDTTPSKTISSIAAPQNLTAVYNDTNYVLSFYLAPTVWNLDTMNSSTTRTMTAMEKITAINTGTVPLDFGLRTDEELTSWSAAISPYSNQYVLRAIFNTLETMPTHFNVFNDYVKNTIFWSSTTVFGPDGYNMAPATYLNLWLQFVAPSSSFDYTRQTIILKVVARPSIY